MHHCWISLWNYSTSARWILYNWSFQWHHLMLHTLKLSNRFNRATATAKKIICKYRFIYMSICFVRYDGEKDYKLELLMIDHSGFWSNTTNTTSWTFQDSLKLFYLTDLNQSISMTKVLLIQLQPFHLHQPLHHPSVIKTCYSSTIPVSSTTIVKNSLWLPCALA